MKNEARFQLVLGAVLALAIPAAAHAAMSFTFPDPVGDTFGLGPLQHDLVGTEVTLTGTDITFSVLFDGPISRPSELLPDGVFGFLDLDVDQDASTGESSNVSLFGIEPSGLGIEYFVDLFSEVFTPGFVDLVDASTLFPTASLPISFSSDSFSVTIPLSELDGDEGFVDFGVIAGTLGESTDQMVGKMVPEPSTVLTWSVLAVCFVAAGLVRYRRQRLSSHLY